MKAFVTLAVLCLAQYLKATEVEIKEQCAEECTVKDLVIKDCGNGPPYPCVLNINSTYTIEFKYTPEFSAEEVKLESFIFLTNHREYHEFPFLQQGKSACDYTECPLEQGKEGFFSQEVQIPFSTFPYYYGVKWALTDPATSSSCCAKFEIEIDQES